MKWKVEELKSVGPITFNHERPEVRRSIDEEPRVYAQSEAILPHDTYEDLGLFVMYDKYNRCGAVEFMKPVQLMWKGADLFSFNYSEALELLKQEDNGIVESDKDAISFELGIALFAPDKETNPTTAIETITLFRENYFYRKIGVCDPDIFQSLLVQHGFVNSITQDFQSFDTLERAYRHIFRSNTENLILIWNSFPIAWSYTNDIPVFAEPLIEMLHKLSSNPKTGEITINLESSNIEAKWTLKWDGTYLELTSFWNRIGNNFEQVINHWQNIRMLQSEFLWEWKLVMEQLFEAVDHAGATGIQELPIFEKLEELQTAIQSPGRFYRQEMRELYF